MFSALPIKQCSTIDTLHIFLILHRIQRLRFLHMETLTNSIPYTLVVFYTKAGLNQIRDWHCSAKNTYINKQKQNKYYPAPFGSIVAG